VEKMTRAAHARATTRTTCCQEKALRGSQRPDSYLYKNGE